MFIELFLVAYTTRWMMRMLKFMRRMDILTILEMLADTGRLCIFQKLKPLNQSLGIKSKNEW